MECGINLFFLEKSPELASLYSREAIYGELRNYENSSSDQAIQ